MISASQIFEYIKEYKELAIIAGLILIAMLIPRIRKWFAARKEKELEVPKPAFAKERQLPAKEPKEYEMVSKAVELRNPQNFKISYKEFIKEKLDELEVGEKEIIRRAGELKQKLQQLKGEESETVNKAKELKDMLAQYKDVKEQYTSQLRRL